MSPKKTVAVESETSPVFGGETEELLLLRRLAKELRKAGEDGSIDTALDTLTEVEKCQKKRRRKH